MDTIKRLAICGLGTLRCYPGDWPRQKSPKELSTTGSDTEESTISSQIETYDRQRIALELNKLRAAAHKWRNECRLGGRTVQTLDEVRTMLATVARSLADADKKTYSLEIQKLTVPIVNKGEHDLIWVTKINQLISEIQCTMGIISGDLFNERMRQTLFDEYERNYPEDTRSDLPPQDQLALLVDVEDWIESPTHLITLNFHLMRLRYICHFSSIRITEDMTETFREASAEYIVKQLKPEIKLIREYIESKLSKDNEYSYTQEQALYFTAMAAGITPEDIKAGMKGEEKTKDIVETLIGMGGDSIEITHSSKRGVSF